MCLCVCHRVNELVQLATMRLTAPHVTVADSQQGSSVSHNVVVMGDTPNGPTSVETTTSTQLNGIVSHHSGHLHSANNEDGSIPPSPVNNHVTPSTAVSNTLVHTLQRGTAVPASSDNAQPNQEAALTSCGVIEPQIPMLSTHLSGQTVNGPPPCTADTVSIANESSVSMNLVYSVISPAVCVGSVTLPTVQLPSVNGSVQVETSVSSSMDELCWTSAADTVLGNDVVGLTDRVVSDVLPVTASAHTVGHVTPARTSQRTADAISMEIGTEDKLTSPEVEEQMLGNTLIELMPGNTGTTSSSGADNRRVPTKVTSSDMDEQMLGNTVSELMPGNTKTASSSDVDNGKVPMKVTSSDMDEQMLGNTVREMMPGNTGTTSAVDNGKVPSKVTSSDMDEQMLGSAVSELMPGNTGTASSSDVDNRKVPAKIRKCVAAVTDSSGLVNSVVTTVTATATNPTSTVSSIMSLIQQTKTNTNESSGMANAASTSRKRQHKLSTSEVADSSELEEKRSKLTKPPDDSSVGSSTARLPLVGSEDISSAVKVLSGLTDVQRISCYKMIGSREERRRVIALRTAERLRRMAEKRNNASASTKPPDKTEKSPVMGNVDKSKSGGRSREESNSSGSSSPKKTARRVPLVTVSTTVPATPTLFTLRSRARLARLQQKDGMSQDSTESQQCIAQTGIQEKTSMQADIDGSIQQTVTYKAVRPADRGEPDSGVPVVSQSRELASTETVQPCGPAAEKTIQPHEVQNQRANYQSRSSLKPDSNSTATASTSASTVACRLKTSKPRVAATGDVNDKPGVSGNPKSASVVGNNTSASIKTSDVTSSKSDNDRNVAVGAEIAKTGANKRQSNIETRSSSRNSGRSDSSKTVTSRSVPDNQLNPEPDDLKAGRGKAVSNTKDVGKSDTSKTVTIGSAPDNSCNNLPYREPDPVKVGHGKAVSDTKDVVKSDSSRTVASRSVPDNQHTRPRDPRRARHEKAVPDTKGGSQRTSSSGKNATSSCNTSEPVKPVQAVSENKTLGQNRPKVSQEDTVSSIRAEKTVGKNGGNRQTSERTNEQTGTLRRISVEQYHKARQARAISQDSVTVAPSQTPNSADTTVVCNNPSTSVAANTNLSQGVDASVSDRPVARRMSSKPDLRHTVLDSSAEKQLWINSKPTTPTQQVNVSFDISLAANTSSPLPGWSGNRKESIDLFDVAIAGTPVQYPCPDDTFDDMLTSPFDVDVVTEGGDAAGEDLASAVDDFAAPDNPVAEAVDESLCGKCVLSVMLVRI